MNSIYHTFLIGSASKRSPLCPAPVLSSGFSEASSGAGCTAEAGAEALTWGGLHSRSRSGSRLLGARPLEDQRQLLWGGRTEYRLNRIFAHVRQSNSRESACCAAGRSRNSAHWVHHLDTTAVSC